ncbi:hypothetical protein O6H91_07G040000 [Diphasiastrum complanatum]|uniref:Uncharacterized protein n=1 Tax=Diphasiastrum complanatum TaxID=34168 RepID=A0ACC2D4G4_DIPCM|nr:hypothetical protein O6H91_07G040000 [Diphasiastrum complanatum]
MPSFNSVTSKEETLEGRNFNLRMQQQTRFSTSYKAGEQFLDYLTIYNPQDSLMYTSSCDINVLPANEVSSLLFPTSQKNSDGMGGSVDQIFYSMSASGLASRPKRSNVKISKDQKRVATRRRRQRIRQQIRILQRLVPGGTKMDTASLLDEAVHYVKFMKLQVQTLKYLCHIAEIPPVPSFVESKLPSLYSPDNLDQLQMSSRATTALYDAMHLHAASSYQASTSKG